MSAITEVTLNDFTDDEIKKEYEERFGEPDEPTLREFSSSELIEELESRDAMPEPEFGLEREDEVRDLIAEAARTSSYAVSAYSYLAEQFGWMPLASIQRLTGGRMGEVA